jgi:hypothetical protein
MLLLTAGLPKLRDSAVTKSSQHFENAVDGPARLRLTDAEAHDAIQPVVVRRSRFKETRGPEIMRCGIDDFALLDAFDNMGRAMSHPAVRHGNERIHRLSSKPDGHPTWSRHHGERPASRWLPRGLRLENLRKRVEQIGRDSSPMAWV